MIPAAREEGVIQVGKVRDDALLLCHAQHAQVPFAQVVAARRLLLRGVAVQDVVIALSRDILLSALILTSPRTSEGDLTDDNNPQVSRHNTPGAEHC